MQRNRYHGKRQYLFIESICNDPDILAQNYRYKMMYSPDYRTSSEDEVCLSSSPFTELCSHLLARIVQGAKNLQRRFPQSLLLLPLQPLHCVL